MWANHYWYVIGSIAKEVEKDNNRDNKLIEKTIQGICSYVPCEQCKKHFKEYIKENPVDVNNLDNWVKKYKNATQKSTTQRSTTQRSTTQRSTTQRGTTQRSTTQRSVAGGCCGRSVYVGRRDESLMKKMQRMKK